MTDMHSVARYVLLKQMQSNATVLHFIVLYWQMVIIVHPISINEG